MHQRAKTEAAIFNPEQPRPSMPRRACPRRPDRRISRLPPRNICVESTNKQIYISGVCSRRVRSQHDYRFGRGEGEEEVGTPPFSVAVFNTLFNDALSAVDGKGDVVPVLLVVAQYISVARQEQLSTAGSSKCSPWDPTAPRGNITWYALVCVPGLGMLFTVELVNKCHWSLWSSASNETSV